MIRSVEPDSMFDPLKPDMQKTPNYLSRKPNIILASSGRAIPLRPQNMDVSGY
jgi:hypothetical protein